MAKNEPQVQYEASKLYQSLIRTFEASLTRMGLGPAVAYLSDQSLVLPRVPGLNTFQSKILNSIVDSIEKKPYYNILGQNGQDYMKREWLIAPSKAIPIAARVHTICQSDADRHLHDHPWANCSVLLEGQYYELMPHDKMDLSEMPVHLAEQVKTTEPVKAYLRKAGDVILRAAACRHRLIVEPGTQVKSLFIIGRKVKDWGFYTEYGFIHHLKYLSNEASL